MSENKRSKTETVNSLQEALLNLEAAKNSGVITEKEYRAKRESILSIPKSRLLWKGIWWKVPVGIVSLIMLLDALDKASSDGKSHRAAIAHTLPSCDSDDAKKAVQNAIKNNASSRVNTLRFLDWRSPRQFSYDGNISERVCNATIFLNAGEFNVTFRMFYPTPASENWLVQVDGIPAGY